MNNCFDNNGHVTKQALANLSNAELTQIQQYEIAEHLSFCDTCIELYVSTVKNQSTIPLTLNTSDNIIKKIRKRIFKTAFNKYTTYVAAACLALIMWGIGPSANLINAPQTIEKFVHSINTNISETQNNLGNNETNLFNSAINILDIF